MLNSECAGHTFDLELYPNFPGNESSGYLLATSLPPGDARHEGLTSEEIDQWNIWSETIIATTDLDENLNPIGWFDERLSQIAAVENLSASYSNGVTDLTWDYPTGLDMGHSIMIYSHYSPATRENWNEMPKTIVSSSVTAGTTSYQIDHSGNSVEREIYYSVTLLYPISEDTRFLGSNTLTSPVWEDNVAPLFLGELDASFDPDTQTTTLDWGEGVVDSDLVINIYRSNIQLQLLDENDQIATVDSALSTYDMEIPFGEHRQSWYAITLEDSTGNEVLDITSASPVSEPVIESTIQTTSVTGLSAERLEDGTITLSWVDNTGNTDAIARVWRSVSGPIDSLSDAEELSSTTVGAGAFSYSPEDAADAAWYAVTIEGTWGSNPLPWHDETLESGANSLSNSVRETAEQVVEGPGITVQIIAMNGQMFTVGDGDSRNLGTIDSGSSVVVITSEDVDSVNCLSPEGSTEFVADTGSRWSMSATNPCAVSILLGEEEISFELQWTIAEDDSEPCDENMACDQAVTCIDGLLYPTTCGSRNCDQPIGTCDDTQQRQNDDQQVDGHEPNEERTITTYAFGILLILFIGYLLVMFKAAGFHEEEE